MIKTFEVDNVKCGGCASTLKKSLLDDFGDVEVNLDDFLQQYIPINFKYWKLYREERIKKETLRFARLNETFQALEVQVEDKIIHQLSEDYIKYLSTFNFLIEDATSILEYLRSNYRLHIITNGFDEVQYKKMDHTVPNLTRKVLIPGIGHWVQQEAPEEVNNLLIEFLKENQAPFEDNLALNMGQILSIPLVLVAIFIMIWRSQKTKKGQNKKKTY